MDWCAHHVAYGEANLRLVSLVFNSLRLVIFVPILELYDFFS